MVKVLKLSGKSPSGKYYKNKYIVVDDFGGNTLKPLSGIKGQSYNEAQKIKRNIILERTSKKKK